jgi:hypothetical protein
MEEVTEPCSSFQMALLRCITEANSVGHTVAQETGDTDSTTWQCKVCRCRTTFFQKQQLLHSQRHCRLPVPESTDIEVSRTTATEPAAVTNTSPVVSAIIDSTRRRRWTSIETSMIEAEVTMNEKKKRWTPEEYACLAEKLGHSDLNLKRKVRIVRNSLIKVRMDMALFE